MVQPEFYFGTDFTNSRNNDSTICFSGFRKTAKLAVNQEKEEANSRKVKSLVKRKSKFTSHSSRENYQKTKKFHV